MSNRLRIWDRIGRQLSSRDNPICPSGTPTQPVFLRSQHNHTVRFKNLWFLA